MALRILAVVGGVDRAGTETWLVSVLRHIDRREIQMGFLVHEDRPYAYSDEIRALGARIIPCLGYANRWIYARNFRRILREHGLYNVVHSHIHQFSGFVLNLAHRAGVPVRIVRYRFGPTEIDALMTLQWWNMSLSKLRENKLFFQSGRDWFRYLPATTIYDKKEAA